MHFDAPDPYPFPQPADGLVAVVALVFGQLALGAVLSPFGKLARFLPGPAWGAPDMVVQTLASGLVLAFLAAYIMAAQGAAGLRGAGVVSQGIGRDALRGLGYALLAFVLGMMATILMITAAEYVVARMGFPSGSVEHFILDHSKSEMITAHKVMNGLGIFVAVCMAPVIEELVFRGLLFRGLRRRLGFWLSAGVSAAVFTGLHFYVAGAPMIFVMGLVAAWTVEKYKSITPALFLHAAWNLRVFIMLWLGRV